MPPSTYVKRISFVRYARICGFVCADANLARHLSGKTTAVCRPDNTYVQLPVEPCALTEHIHSLGYDSHAVAKADVLRYAHRFIVDARDIGLKPITPNPPVPRKSCRAFVATLDWRAQLRKYVALP